MNTPSLEQHQSSETLYLNLLGYWDLEQLSQIRNLLASVPSNFSSVVIDACDIKRFDVNIAWLLHQQVQDWEQQGRTVAFEGFPAEYTQYFSQESLPPQSQKNASLGAKPLQSLGKKWIEGLQLVHSAIAFLGHSLVSLLNAITSRRNLHLSAILHQIFVIGVNAIPIVVMIASLMSIVITYQGGNQLRELGATIYTVDMVAISVLRELGVLLTAIVVAGRSGSAFAAEIGLMKTNQEVDALTVMGSDPFVVLVLPRMLALLIALPLLTLIADIVALLSAAWIAPMLLDISFEQFFARIEERIGLSTFLAGLIKAPFFAVVIAWIGCWQGMLVSGSSESMGKHTTQAVVQSILVVLFLDAVFSILFYHMGF